MTQWCRRWESIMTAASTEAFISLYKTSTKRISPAPQNVKCGWSIMPEYVEISSPMCFWSEHVKALHNSTLIYNIIDLTNCGAFMYYVSNNCNKLYMSCWKPFVFILHERRIYLLVNPNWKTKQLRYNTKLKQD